MPFFENSRAHRRALRVAAALVDYARPEDAMGPSTKQVDGDVWYATMFLYLNHWEAGRAGALPLPDSPYRELPLSVLMERSWDYVVSLVVLLLLYWVLWLPFSNARASNASGSF